MGEKKKVTSGVLTGLNFFKINNNQLYNLMNMQTEIDDMQIHD